MRPETVIRQAAAEGVKLALSPPDNIKVVGDERAVDRWLPVIREQKPEIIAVLHKAAKDTELDAGGRLFDFAPPADDAEALEQRAAIIAEGCGIDQAMAFQEARWQADRERCWQVVPTQRPARAGGASA